MVLLKMECADSKGVAGCYKSDGYAQEFKPLKNIFLLMKELDSATHSFY
jgi:hypothetical protein